MVIFGDIGYCTCIPVQPRIILGKTSNHIEVPWDNSKLKKFSQDKRRNKTVQERVKTSCHAEGSVGTAGNEEQNPASDLPVFSCPVPATKEEEDGLGSEGKCFLCSLWTCCFLRLLSEII